MSRSNLVSTFALTLVLAGGLVACGSNASDSGDAASTGDPTSASPSDTSSASAGLELAVPAAQAGRCMPPSVDNLATQDTAFEGVVTALGEGTATLDVTQVFKGDEVDTVTVVAPNEDLQALLVAVDFQQGQTYLVSSLGGQVSVCGLSGPKDDFLAGLYADAFPT